MERTLFYLECLAALLLAGAALTACAVRAVRPRRRRLLLALAVAVPVLPLLAWAAFCGVAQFGYRWTDRLFAQGLALALAGTAGAAIIAIAGRARRREMPELRAAGWPRGKLLFAAAVAALLAGMTYRNLDLGVGLRLAALRSEAGSIALSVAPARIPDRDNAAFLYDEALGAMGLKSGNKVLTAIPGWQKRWGEKGLGSSFDPSDEELRRFLAGQAPALSILRRAARMPGCWFAHRWYGGPGLDVEPFKFGGGMPAGRLLAFDARSRIAAGDIAGAVEDMHALFVLGDRLADSANILGVIVGITAEGLAFEDLSVLFAERELPAAELAELRIEENFSFGRAFARALRMEEAFCLSSYTLLLGDQLSVGGDRVPTSPTSSVGDPGYDVRRSGFLGCSLYRVFLLEEDLAGYRRFWDWQAPRAVEPPWKASKPSGEEEEWPMGVLSRILAVRVEGWSRKVAEADARRACARTVLALDRAAARGRIPERLDELVPEHLARVPIDPFDGKPLKYARKDGEVVVYSIGPDLADDGGVPIPNQGDGKGDIVLRAKVKS
jgi:hypothetical protein